MPKTTVKPTANVCEALSAISLNQLVNQFVKNFADVQELRKTPAVFFKRHGFSIPARAKIIVRSTAEFHKMMEKRSGKLIFTAGKTVVGHIDGGKAKCTTIVVQ